MIKKKMTLLTFIDIYGDLGSQLHSPENTVGCWCAGNCWRGKVRIIEIEGNTFLEFRQASTADHLDFLKKKIEIFFLTPTWLTRFYPYFCFNSSFLLCLRKKAWTHYNRYEWPWKGQDSLATTIKEPNQKKIKRRKF